MYDISLGKNEKIISTYEINNSHTKSKESDNKTDSNQTSKITVTNKRLVYSDIDETKAKGKTEKKQNLKEIPLIQIETIDTMYYSQKKINKFFVALFGIASLILLFLGFLESKIFLIGTVLCALICFIIIKFAKNESELYLNIGYLDEESNNEKSSSFKLSKNNKTFLNRLIPFIVVCFVLFLVYYIVQHYIPSLDLNLTPIIPIGIIAILALLFLISGIINKRKGDQNINSESTSLFNNKNKMFLKLSDSEIKSNLNILGEQSISYNYINPEIEKLVSELGAIILNNK